VEEAAAELVAQADGPPGVIVVIQRRNDRRVIRAGVANVRTDAHLRVHAHMRLASVAKAFNGATALSLVARQVLSLEDTVGKWRPDLPTDWADITLGQLLNHTSGIPEFIEEQAFKDALLASPLVAPPVQLLSYIENPEPTFTPGTEYKYSNSDNIIVGLMIEAATGRSYERALHRLVAVPFGLFDTTLPSDPQLPRPFVHGYNRDETGMPEDVSKDIAAGWAWASGGVVSTPGDANEFVRRYVTGQETNSKTHAQQFQFVPGSSDPPGPGTNSAGLAIFRYETGCGTVYGHTGNWPGYTQFISATADGKRSATVSIKAQITPELNPVRFAELHQLYELAVCAALD
jgi:D-alanyl-D-alanine carboxypeptidase